MTSGRQGRVRAIHLACLALAGLALLIRVAAVAQPLGIDQSLWASAVRGMDRGQRLYIDVWEQRPPGIFLTYWAAFKLFGWSSAAVVLLDVSAAALTTAALYLTVRILSGSLGGALTAALFAVLTMPAFLYGKGGFLERSVSETFIVTSLALAALCAARYRQRPSSASIAGMGVLIGAAISFKPNAALYFPAFVTWTLMAGGAVSADKAPRRIRALALASAGAAIVPVLMVVWLWRNGALIEARIAVVDFNRWYVGAGFTAMDYAVAFSRSVFLRMKTEPLWLAGVAGSAGALWELGRHRRVADAASLALFWGGAGILVIVVNGARLYNSYFLQAMAPLAVMAGWWLGDLNAGRARRVLAGVTALAMMALLAGRHYVQRVVEDVSRDVALLRGQSEEKTYLEYFGGYAQTSRGYSARANAELAAYVRAWTQSEDRVFLFGINGAGLYFLSDRLTAQRFLRVNFFAPQDFPDPRFRLDAVARELQDRRPVYVIFERLHSTADPAVAKTVDALPEDPAVKALLSDYTLETRIEDFSLYRRR